MYKITFVMDSLKRIEMKYDLGLEELESTLSKAYEKGYFFAPKVVRKGESQNRYFIPMNKVEVVKIKEISNSDKSS